MGSKNKFLMRRKEDGSELLGEEVEWLFFEGTISFGGGRTKVGGLNLIMGETFSWESIVYFLFDLTWLVLAVELHIVD